MSSAGSIKESYRERISSVEQDSNTNLLRSEKMIQINILNIFKYLIIYLISYIKFK